MENGRFAFEPPLGRGNVRCSS